MQLSEILSEGEINELVLAPVRIFHLIAEADDKIDKKEIKSFEYFLANAKKLDSELSLFCFNKVSNMSQLEELKSLSKIGNRESLRYISGFLGRKVEREIAIDYKITLIALGYYIAFSSGSFLAHKVSDDESDVLSSICKDLDLSYRELLSSNQIQKILDKISE
jgi:tellurite resistance protein